MKPYTIFDPADNRECAATLDDIAGRFERDGVVVLPRFIDSARLAHLNAAVDAHYAPLLADAAAHLSSARAGQEQFECDVIGWNPDEDAPGFAAVRHDAALCAVTAACLGEGFTTPGIMVFLAVGGGKGQAWHQDCPVMPNRAFNLNRLLYTRDVTYEDGATVVVPGSHLWGRIPPGGNQDAIEGEVALTPAAGTLVIMHGRVYHRVTPNRTGRPRLSINFRAFAQGVSPGVCSIGVYRNGAFDFGRNELVAQ